MLRECDASDHELADLDADRRHADVRPIDRDGVATAIEQILAERIEMTERPRAGLETIDDAHARWPEAPKPVARSVREAATDE